MFRDGVVVKTVVYRVLFIDLMKRVCVFLVVVVVVLEVKSRVFYPSQISSIKLFVDGTHSKLSLSLSVCVCLYTRARAKERLLLLLLKEDEEILRAKFILLIAPVF